MSWYGTGQPVPYRDAYWLTETMDDHREDRVVTEYGCGFCGLVAPSVCFNRTAAHDCPHAPGARFKEGPLSGLRKWHYGTIYADPAWTYETRSDKGKDRSPERHYDCMTLDEIRALPVGDLAARDCALFMWAIDTHLDQALDVIRSWGFEYKTVAFHWMKTHLKGGMTVLGDDEWAPVDDDLFVGMGHWTRANPEICLLATRGAPKRLAADVRRVIVSPRREHSRKPDEAYERIERLVGGPYCELFSRSSRPGWDQAGNEKGKFDRLDPVELAEIEELI